ncbi:hypothetical protein [Gimesia panareensis]|uniref:hypothetical protein n=1 Tax=Gimesia panareensis TaxID=2527978 RepID=UPI0011884E3C|nr:hypothetical protein [Gimesia panareensis]QDU50900.1 hypothetical protein Pan110_32610 [Gimesia panareensis]
MTENPRTRRQRRLIYSLPFLLLGYILSIGPVGVLLQSGDGYFKPGALQLLQFLYAPLIIASMKYPWLSTLMMKYSHFWQQIL